MATTLPEECPRCGNPLPNPFWSTIPGAPMGAMSRTDNDTEVCTICGLDEAMEQSVDAEHRLTPQSEWPIDSWRDDTIAIHLQECWAQLHQLLLERFAPDVEA